MGEVSEVDKDVPGALLVRAVDHHHAADDVMSAAPDVGAPTPYDASEDSPQSRLEIALQILTGKIRATILEWTEASRRGASQDVLNALKTECDELQELKITLSPSDPRVDEIIGDRGE
jgi:hypothetical protein